MNENLNLVEILKGCPKGTKLYSTIYGEVKLYSIEEKHQYPIIFTKTTGYTNKVTADGRHLVDYNGECTLFPSKGQRDWSIFIAPWYKKEKASLQTNDREWLYLVSDVLTWKDGIGQYLDDPRVQNFAKRLCREYAQKLYNAQVLSNSSNTGKNERKFKVGDWAVDYYCRGRVVKLTDDAYLLDTGQGIPFSCEHNAHLWTIQDAKDGDVLSFYNEYRGNKMVQIGIIEKYVGKHGGCSNTFKIYVGVNWDNNLQMGKYMGCSVIHPATKEQRDLLFQKIKEAGYEWDADKKELKKLVEVPNKFDPKTLKAFDRVLVRDSDNESWCCDLFSHIKEENIGYKYVASGFFLYRCCIPYNDETKHLVGTTEEAPEYYRYWED